MNWIKSIKKFGQSLKKYIKKRPGKQEQENADWINCSSCKKLQYKNDIKNRFYICECGYHFDCPPKERFKNIFDNSEYEIIEAPKYMNADPLDFKIDGVPYISKREQYEKKTGQDSALLIGQGKINDLNAIVVCSNFKFGGGAMTPKESEHLVTAAARAIEQGVDIFVSILQSGGMAVTTGVPGLTSGMVKTQIAFSEMKSAGILTIGIACSKLTGGTYVVYFNHDILGVESGSSHDILFSGKRVTANLKTGQEIPEDFGKGSSLEALTDIIFNDRSEIKEGITKISRVILKKPKEEFKSDNPLQTIDESIEDSLSKTPKAV